LQEAKALKAPWANKTGAAKLTAIFATSLLIALGLCGVNFVATIRFVPLSGPGNHVPPTTQERTADLISNLLGFTAFFEIAVILISIVGLVFGWLAMSFPKSKDNLDKK
jgi:hypothetical protein